jgi:hypothetical protein
MLETARWVLSAGRFFLFPDWLDFSHDTMPARFLV